VAYISIIMSDIAHRPGKSGAAAQGTAPAAAASSSPATPATSAAASAPATPAAAKDAAPKDVVLLGPPTADGEGVHVIRAREERIETGELRALQHGKPITGEVVTLKPREDNPRICDVQESFSAGSARTHKGPPRVATDAYRDGWDEIFGKRSAGSSNEGTAEEAAAAAKRRQLN